MKIKVLHNNSARFEFIRRAAAEKNPAAEISGSVFAGGAMPAVINGSAPDVLIVDEATRGCLDAIESLSLVSPGIDIVLISADTSAEFLMHAMRSGVREVVPSNASHDALQAALTRLSQKRIKQTGSAAPEGKVFAFLSCKGGSGATFLAANFAYVLATEYGKRVALIDLNLQFGDAAMFVSESHPPSNLAELSQQIHRLDASLLAASMLEVAPNFFVLAAPDNPDHLTDVQREHIDTIVRLARLHYDFVVLDLPRSLNGVSLQVLDVADMIFPVMQLTLPFVRDGKRLLTIFRSLDYPRSKIKVIVNRYEKGGEFTLDDLEKAIDGRIAYVVPNSYRAAAASVNLGIPIAKANRNDPISKFLIEMGREFVPEETLAANGGWFSRIFSR
ncbi:AAA family ATPase [Propionivibrio limicola]|uniref:AAA family ATPase n=1 Tax=Propionivibrio limicola TaxID=167645 RepID=UPI001478571A|nr:AAA family ATPase [Propionivibrio limicola]